MHETTPWEEFLNSLRYLWVFFTDNVVAVASFLIIGLATLVAHKSVEQLRFWGVPSMYIERMEVMHAFVWLMGAVAMAGLCVVATFRFCRKVSRGWL